MAPALFNSFLNKIEHPHQARSPGFLFHVQEALRGLIRGIIEIHISILTWIVHMCIIDTNVYAFRSWGQLTVFSYLILPYRYALWISSRQAFGRPSGIPLLVQSYKDASSIGDRRCFGRYRSWGCRYKFFLFVNPYKYLFTFTCIPV